MTRTINRDSILWELREYDVVWYSSAEIEEVERILIEERLDYTTLDQGSYVAVALAQTTGHAARRI